MTQSLPVFVIAAQISSHLHAATKIAQQLSLTAKNASAITSRAGQVAVGFAAITKFIQDLALNTINLATDINKTAIQISSLATDLARTKQAQNQFNNVMLRAEEATYIDSITPMLTINKGQVSFLDAKFSELIKSLSGLLDETEKEIRSASFISSISKIEASKSGIYQHQLDVIAQSIESSARQIQEELNIANQLLLQTKQG